MNARPYQPGDCARIEFAIECMRDLRTSLHEIGAEAAAACITRAIEAARDAGRRAERLRAERNRELERTQNERTQ